MLMHFVRLTVAATLVASFATSEVSAQPRTTLQACLAAIEKDHRITILVHPSVQRGTQPAQCADTSDPETALRTLLRAYDFFLQYAAASDAQVSRLQRVWVFARGAVESMRILPQEETPVDSCQDDFNAQLSGALTRSIEEASGLVARALEDPDENVRQQALEAIQRESLPVAQHLIEGVFLGDPSDNVRAAALETLASRASADGSDVSTTLDRALQDPSPLVHERALALLESLGIDPPPTVRPPVKPGRRN